MARLAVVISHPIQHFAPLFRDLGNVPELELRVFYCCDWGIADYTDPGFGQTFKWDVPLLDGYDYEFLPIDKRPSDLGFFSIDNPTVGQRLGDFSPDAVWIHGYSHRTSWRTYLWALKHRRKILYFGDSELLSPRGIKARLFKRAVLPYFFSRCDAFLTIGDNNEAYYRHYGVPDRRMFRGSFPVDIARFRDSANAISKEERIVRRQHHGLHSNALVALFSGKLIDIKRPLDLVAAVHRLRYEIPSLQALILGSGPLEGKIREQIRGYGLSDRVILTGFVNQSQIPSVLHLGDILTMCSERDPHPLAVTEAMSVGNAIIASDRVGCVGPTDAAREGQNALIYRCGQIEEICECIRTLHNNRDLLQRFQSRSIELAKSQDTSVMVQAVLTAISDRTKMESTLTIRDST